MNETQMVTLDDLPDELECENPLQSANSWNESEELFLIFSLIVFKLTKCTGLSKHRGAGIGIRVIHE
jgi:hypothetical protein